MRYKTHKIYSTKIKQKKQYFASTDPDRLRQFDLRHIVSGSQVSIIGALTRAAIRLNRAIRDVGHSNIRHLCRWHSDYLFIYRHNSVREQRQVYEHYTDLFPSFESFRRVYLRATEDEGYLVIANRNPNPTNKIWMYRASV